MPKIAFISRTNPVDIEKYSGTTYHIHEALANQDFDIYDIYKLNERYWTYLRWKRKIYKDLFGKRFLIDRSPLRAYGYAKELKKQINGHDIDVIFSDSSLTISTLKTEIPIVFYTDSTFAGMVDYYDGFSNLSRKTVKDGMRFEKMALKNCSKAIYTSKWAADSAIKDYGADPAKVEIIPYGANFQVEKSQEEMQDIIGAKTFDKCRLLFVGKDWGRKGGNLAVNVVKKLNEIGIPSTLSIVGCEPEIDPSIQDFVEVHGYLNKAKKEDLDRMVDLYHRAHYFILPTYAECFGIAFAEASSFGLPNLALDTGGVASAVTDGKSGKLFDISATADDFVSFIKPNFTDQNAYSALAESSYREYLQRLNWNASGKRLSEVISSLI
ncbi:glycosyltransferase family 4 protein [Fulvivirgaceae bacterium BMA10]|uniref:Glycosyltransferase family 4 protein n=1 Tax=Splendidivirga corallicola TaxID=3051826 RepID=A0ABT8KQT7_9BACT|nr:glycosyltransferase family 4 protein [Fulvivirgaceae bacterium BMA10]